MKITKTKIKKELEKNYAWIDLNVNDSTTRLIDAIISDTLKIVNDILIKQKGIKIK